jgi:hypothetical protein
MEMLARSSRPYRSTRAKRLKRSLSQLTNRELAHVQLASGPAWGRLPRSFTMSTDDVHPSVHLPALSTLRTLPPEQREEALSGWVLWLNANRHLVSSDFERKLDEALFDFDNEALHDGALAELDEHFATWLETAGKIGVGHGPGEGPEDF